MPIEIINTGSELLLGRVLNTHQQWLCRQLTDLGYTVTRQTAVSDTGDAIQTALREALTRADLIITTGGLGPTSDDRTRDLVAALLGVELIQNDEVLARITDFFVSRKRPMPESTKIQAMVPREAIVLMNANGTAPGLAMEVPAGKFRSCATLLIMLPGPPRELRPMFTTQIIPLLKEKLPLGIEFVCRTLKTTGLGESRVEEIIAPQLKHLIDAGLELGYCARVGEVDVRFIARGCGAQQNVAEAESITRQLISEHVFGVDDEQLEDALVRLLTERKQTLALAESCTGGFIANRITNVPGASAVLWGSGVTYANDAKQKWVGVNQATLDVHGAVSEQTAREMAEGVRRVSGADYAVSVTGIAGPSGGSDEKPAGTVFIGFASASGSRAYRFVNRFDRETFKYVTSQQALEILRRALLKH
ncbi:MAG TPA: competence/damage-inducible protein A [Verrucomicrobiae bacterium]